MSEQLNRRDFLNKSMRVSAGIVVGGAGSRSAHSALTKEEMENAARIGHTRSYNPKMEYRRLGKTGLWVSAVCLGGHWKRIDKVIGTGEINPYNAPTDKEQFGPFMKNREDVIHYCLEQGINCIDLAGDSEAEVYCRALGKSRDKIYLAYSHPASELRVPDNRKADKLLDLFKAGQQGEIHFGHRLKKPFNHGNICNCDNYCNELNQQLAWIAEKESTGFIDRRISEKADQYCT